MLESERMLKVEIAGPKSLMKETIEVLYRLNVLHITEHLKSEEDVFDIGKPLEEGEEYADMIVKTRAIASFLNITPRRVKLKKDTDTNKIKIRLNKLYEDISALQKKLKYYDKVIELYPEQAKLLKEAGFQLKLDADYSKQSHFFGFVDDDIEEEISSKVHGYELYSLNIDNVKLIGLFVDTKNKDKARQILAEHSFSPIEEEHVTTMFPDLKAGPGMKIQKGKQLNMLHKLKDELNGKIEDIKKDNQDFILEVENHLTMKVEIAEAPLKFATSENSFIITGWVPKKKCSKLESELNKATKKKVHFKAEMPDKHDKVPVAFKHPKIVEPFQFFMNLYTLPSYGEIDPSFFMFLTFPLFFGFMLGDVGYGLITLVLFLIIKRKMESPEAKGLLNAMIFASLSTIFFGLLFGEYFGIETFTLNNVIYDFPRVMSRMHQINDLLSLSVLIGVIHVAIGILIGFVNIYKHHGLKHAFMEKAGWLLLLPILLWLMSSFLKIITGPYADFVNSILPSLGINGLLAGVGFVIILIGEGTRGAIEIPGILSNILSYGRLMAVGLASVSLAAVVNEMAGELFQTGVIGILVAVLILIIGHTINIALGILSPFLHSLRLHYVEFFTKFFKGGGTRYISFGRKE
ncbi:V-type ATP synthase subunit I [Candidatus Woesearchaeota archaeon]|nr:V-type ATP synthase subunit I [Candidatus Woesearchaeota archaeon]